MTRHTRSQSKSSASASEKQPKPSPGSGMDLLDGSGATTTSSSGSLFPAYVGEEEQNDSGGKVHIHVPVRVTSSHKKNYNHE